MPIFEYRCPDCGAVREELVLSGEDVTLFSCPQCGRPGMERILSAHCAPPSFSRPHGTTCCGREERCSTPPCSSGGGCQRG